MHPGADRLGRLSPQVLARWLAALMLLHAAANSPCTAAGTSSARPSASMLTSATPCTCQSAAAPANALLTAVLLAAGAAELRRAHRLWAADVCEPGGAHDRTAGEERCGAVDQRSAHAWHLCVQHRRHAQGEQRSRAAGCRLWGVCRHVSLVLQHGAVHSPYADMWARGHVGMWARLTNATQQAVATLAVMNQAKHCCLFTRCAPQATATRVPEVDLRTRLVPRSPCCRHLLRRCGPTGATCPRHTECSTHTTPARACPSPTSMSLPLRPGWLRYQSCAARRAPSSLRCGTAPTWSPRCSTISSCEL